MIQNEHYFIKNVSQIKYFLLTIDYDNFNNKVILESNPCSKNLPFPSIPGYGDFTPACGYDISGSWYSILPTGNVTNITDGDYKETSISIPLTEAPNFHKFGLVVGFNSGFYTGSNRSTFNPSIRPNFVSLYYKPSNIIFGVQGSVDSSTYIDRVKLNAVTRNGYLTKSAYGSATANAMAYGVSEQPYTIKNVIGFKTTATPIIKKDGSVCRDEKFIYRM
jgi:hypothetical protein